MKYLSVQRPWLAKAVHPTKAGSQALAANSEVFRLVPILGLGAALGAGLLPNAAQAACFLTSASQYNCSGATTITQSIIAPGATLTTTDDFSISTPTGDGIVVVGDAALSYNDQHSSMINADSGTALTLRAGTPTNQGGQGITVFTNGSISAGSAGTAIEAINRGAGGIGINATGPLVGGTGIRAENYGGTDIRIETGAVTATARAGTYIGSGIYANNQGTGDATVTANGVISSNERGVIAYSKMGNATVTTNGEVIARGSGIFAQVRSGDGKNVINANGDVLVTGTGRPSEGVAGIAAVGGDVNINANGRLMTSSSKNEVRGSIGIAVLRSRNVDIKTSGSISAETFGIGVASGLNQLGLWGRSGLGGAAPSSSDTVGGVNVTADGDITVAGVASGSSASPVSAIFLQSIGNRGAANITTSGILTATETGIFVGSLEDTSAAGDTRINVKEGSVVQGGVEAIRLFADTQKMAQISNAGTLQNSSGDSDATVITSLAEEVFNKSARSNLLSVSVVNSGVVLGTVVLAGPGNAFTNRMGGVWNTAGSTNDFGFDVANNRISNEAGGTIVAALGDRTTTTTFSGIGSFSNAGRLTMENDTAGDRTVIDGEYVSDGGVVALDTVLGGDDSPTDRLIINGGTSGSGLVQVRNAGGAGAPTVDGIKVIEVAGASNGTFSLLGDYRTKDGNSAVVAGAYAYTLHQDDVATSTGGDWYLRSQMDPAGRVTPTEPVRPRYQPGASVYESYPQALLGLNGVPTLQQRVGNRMWSGTSTQTVGAGAEGNGVWGRIEGAHRRMDTGRSTTGVDYKQDAFTLQAGIDGLLSESAGGTLIGGMNAHYVNGRAATLSAYDAINGGGSIRTVGYGFGGSLTWYGDNGAYVDAQGRATWYSSDLNYDGGGRPLGDSRKAFGYALSMEAGKRFALTPEWSLTPQAQLVYSSVKFDDFNDPFGSAVSLDKGESLEGRLGLALAQEASWQSANGVTYRSHVYGIANLSHELLGETRVKLDDVTLKNGVNGLGGGVGIGGSYSWNDGKYSFYGEGLVNTSLSSFADSYSLSATLGFRAKW